MTMAGDTAQILAYGQHAGSIARELTQRWADHTDPVMRRSPHPYGFDSYDQDAAAAGTLAAVLDHLVAVGDLDALRVAIGHYERYSLEAIELTDEIDAEHQADDAAEDNRRADAHAEAGRRHALAIGVECPCCGAQPGADCRTAGPSGRGYGKGVHDHGARYRAATSR